MKLLVSYLPALWCTLLLAQQKPYVIKRDTINIHGYIYDNAGKGVDFMYIQSTQLETEHNTFKLGAFTNDRGYFEMKGARFNDTLTLGPDIRYDLSPYYNQGSRFVVINLPPAKVMDLNADGPLVISQKRKNPVAIPSFTVTPTANIPGTPPQYTNAQFPGGNAQLQEFIKQNIRYPDEAVKKNLEGIVKIIFTVTKEGYLKDYKILNGVSDDCDGEALRVIKKSPKWQPAIDHDQPVAIQEVVSIQFKLTDN